MTDERSTSAPLLRLDEVGKSWAGRPAVTGVSLEVRAGEAVALVGSPGRGSPPWRGSHSGCCGPTAGR
ncbi:hypothetical protein [Kitasatospora cheerisanensis]|uniref:hypothetical protein n=1 Tax=Kitasatospora cheerisanensis TaxID=81942 RepID=UPI000A48BF0D|nr:hypothetical protein [Kitasatospora cheerisanensis]